MWPTPSPPANTVPQREYFEFSQPFLELQLWGSQVRRSSSRSGGRPLLWTLVSSVLTHSTRIDELDALLMNALLWLNSPATGWGQRSRRSPNLHLKNVTRRCANMPLACWLSGWGHGAFNFLLFFHPLRAGTETFLTTFHRAFTSRRRKLLLLLPEVVVNRLFGAAWLENALSERHPVREWCRRSQPTRAWHHYPNKGKIIIMSKKKKHLGFRRRCDVNF